MPLREREVPGLGVEPGRRPDAGAGAGTPDDVPAASGAANGAASAGAGARRGGFGILGRGVAGLREQLLRLGKVAADDGRGREQHWVLGIEAARDGRLREVPLGWLGGQREGVE